MSSPHNHNQYSVKSECLRCGVSYADAMKFFETHGEHLWCKEAKKGSSLIRGFTPDLIVMDEVQEIPTLTDEERKELLKRHNDFFKKHMKRTGDLRRSGGLRLSILISSLNTINAQFGSRSLTATHDSIFFITNIRNNLKKWALEVQNGVEFSMQHDGQKQKLSIRVMDVSGTMHTSKATVSPDDMHHTWSTIDWMKRWIENVIHR